MRGQTDAGQSLILRVLRNQYESCLARYGIASSAFDDTSLFDYP